MTSRLSRALLSLVVSAGFLAVVFKNVQAAPIVNGDFTDPVDLAGWTPTGTVVGEPTGEFAQLETDGNFLRTLEQSFTLPATASTLTFDFAFSTEAAMPGVGFMDSFAASLETTGGDFLDILVVDFSALFPIPRTASRG